MLYVYTQCALHIHIRAYNAIRTRNPLGKLDDVLNTGQNEAGKLLKHLTPLKDTVVERGREVLMTREIVFLKELSEERDIVEVTGERERG